MFTFVFGVGRFNSFLVLFFWFRFEFLLQRCFSLLDLSPSRRPGTSSTTVVTVVSWWLHRFPLPYRLHYEPVVMVWSSHSHIGRCSCGDSWIPRVVCSLMP